MVHREVVIDHVVRGEADVAGVLAQEALGEDRRRQEVEPVSLHRLQIPHADLGPVGDVAQGDLAHLALPPEPATERSSLRRSRLFFPRRLAKRTLGPRAGGIGWGGVGLAGRNCFLSRHFSRYATVNSTRRSARGQIPSLVTDSDSSSLPARPAPAARIWYLAPPL